MKVDFKERKSKVIRENNYVSQFKKVLNEELPDMKVRYIF